MTVHEEKMKILNKYSSSLSDTFPIQIKDSITEKQLKNIRKHIAPNVDQSRILGFCDTTLGNTGAQGYLITDSCIYYLESFKKPQKLWYDEIESVALGPQKKKDCDRSLYIHLKDGDVIIWSSIFLNKTPLCEFIKEIMSFKNDPLQQVRADINSGSRKNPGADAGGYSVGAYGQVNKLFEEEKFHASQGHGFAAERANTLYDRLKGHDARIVGDDNAKNGADRIVDGVYIQSKYCQTGAKCISECFDENGVFRYLIDGKPMQIEVPADNYDAAVEAMQEQIRQGKIPGVTDPEQAKEIVRKGNFTYQQAKNIAKAGTVESLTYDAVNGAIIATSAFGVTAMITLAANLWNGEDFGKSMKIATYSGLKVGGTAFVTTIIASQLSKAGLNSALVGSSETVVALMGPKASAVLINAFRSGSKIYGAAAMKSAAKLLRGNIITAGVTVVVLSTFDIANIFRGRISGKQLFKNLTNTTVTVAAGTGGWLVGAAAGTAIFPGVGTLVGVAGGLIGSVVSGAVAGKATNAVLGKFVEDDADEMVRIIQKRFEVLSTDYLLNQDEAEKIVDNLSKSIDGKVLKNMFASKGRNEFADSLLIPLVEAEVKKRPHIKALTDEQIISSLKDVLEEISDNMEPALA